MWFMRKPVEFETFAGRTLEKIEQMFPEALAAVVLVILPLPDGGVQPQMAQFGIKPGKEKEALQDMARVFDGVESTIHERG